MFAEFKKKLKGYLRQNIKQFVEECKKYRLSQKSIGVIVRSVHMAMPANFMYIVMFAPQTQCIITVIGLFIVMTMFYMFDGCFLSILEKELCNDDFTILDPPLELLNMETNGKNRFFISNVLGITYMVAICLIYYVRFMGRGLVPV